MNRTGSPRGERLRGIHRLLFEVNNLLLIPVFSVILVDILALGLGISTIEVDGLETAHDLMCASFFAEWALGLGLSRDRLAYLRSPARLADLVSSIPIGHLFQSARATRFARALRLLRLAGHARRLRGREQDILRVTGLITATALSGAVALRMLEPSTVPTFEDALWWSIVTMSTVGYGDISPATSIGRGVAMTMIILGIAIFGYAISVLTSVIVDPSETQEGGPYAQERNETQESLRRLEDRLERIEAALAVLLEHDQAKESTRQERSRKSG